MNLRTGLFMSAAAGVRRWTIRFGHQSASSRRRLRGRWLDESGCIFLLLIVLFAAGCTTPSAHTLPRVVKSFPDEALITQRGVLTVRGRQFSLNGYLARSATGAQRLIVTENFGGVIADLIIKPDGTVHVMRSSRAFKPAWIRRHIAADVQCIFGGASREDCPGRQLSENHFVIERRSYTLDLQIVETKPGPQSTELFDETKKKTR